MANVPAIPVVIAVTGAYLAWFGVHYWGSDVKWPSDPMKAVLTGNSLPDNARSTPQIPFTEAPNNTQTETGEGTTSPSPTPGQHESPQYTHAEISTLWTSNGGHSSTANLAAAIAEAESSGDANSTSGNPDGGTNVGLWQLDTKGVGTGYTVDQLKDPATNARITVMGSSNGTNWSQWETFANGAYKKFL